MTIYQSSYLYSKQNIKIVLLFLNIILFIACNKATPSNLNNSPSSTANYQNGSNHILFLTSADSSKIYASYFTDHFTGNFQLIYQSPYPGQINCFSVQYPIILASGLDRPGGTVTFPYVICSLNKGNSWQVSSLNDGVLNRNKSRFAGVTTSAIYNESFFLAGDSSYELKCKTSPILNEIVPYKPVILQKTDSINTSPALFTKILFTSNGEGYMAGVYRKNIDIASGFLYKTIDSGKTWNFTSVVGTDGGFYSLCSLSSNELIAGMGCFDGIAIYKSVDKGNTWTKTYQYHGNQNNAINDIQFFSNNQYGLAVGGMGVLLKTSDGGNNWKPIALPSPYNNLNLYRIAILGNQAWIVGARGLLLESNDIGNTWNQIATNLPSTGADFNIIQIASY